MAKMTPRIIQLDVIAVVCALLGILWAIRDSHKDAWIGFAPVLGLVSLVAVILTAFVR